MLLAANGFDIGHISDHPWSGWVVELFGMRISLMSSTIASMLLAAGLIVLLVVPAARRYTPVPRGRRNIVEVLVIFVRDSIAIPAMHDREKAYRFLPFLLTIFTFILVVNLLGLVPLLQITDTLGLPPVGGTATGIMAVPGALAAMVLVLIVGLALKHQTVKYHTKRGWPIVVAAALSPATWFLGFAPHIKGVAGIFLVPLLTVLEFVGVAARCFALMIRLFANMISGHTLLAVMAMLGLQAAASALQGAVISGTLVSIVCVLASVLLQILELLVAGIQAYVFTILAATFLSLYVEPGH